MCAFAQAAHDTGDDFDLYSGKSILMMIYANGLGVKRNLDVATHYACEIPDSLAGIAGRIDHLQKLKHAGAHDSTFDVCDDVTSGAAAGMCSTLDRELSQIRQTQRLDAIANQQSSTNRALFTALRKAANVYAETSSDDEVDMSGTMRVVELDARHALVLHRFEALLDWLDAHGNLAVAGTLSYPDANALLNRVYQQVMAIKTSAVDHWPGAVTLAGIRASERTWLTYRNSWLAYASQRYPALRTPQLMALLTCARTNDLYEFRPADGKRPASLDHCLFVTRTLGTTYALKQQGASLPPASQAALTTLQRALGDYLAASGAHEAVDSATRSRRKLAIYTQFSDTVASVNCACGLPGKFASADDALNARYAAVMAHAFDPPITHAGIRTTERAWLRYRDAWARYARQQYPAVSVDALQAKLSQQRAALLRNLM